MFVKSVSHQNSEPFFVPKSLNFAEAYPVHHTKIAQKYALMLNILIVKIHEGMTNISSYDDEYQPLDNMIFGNVK